jgi:hypothetical protein
MGAVPKLLNNLFDRSVLQFLGLAYSEMVPIFGFNIEG